MSEESMSEAIESVESSEVESNESVEMEDSSEQSESILSEANEGAETTEVQAETTEQLEEEIKDAVEEGATEEEVANMIRQFTLKVNGKEFVKEIDLSDEDTLKRELQLAHAGRAALQEKAELEKLYNSEVDRLRNDPFKVLEELGLNPLDLSAEYLEKFLQEQEKSPEQKEAESRARELEELRAERDKLRKDAEEKQRAAEMAKAEKEIEEDILSALDSDPELPNTPKVIGKVADMMLWAYKNGHNDVTAKDVIPSVKKELKEEIRDVVSNISDIEILKEIIGKDVTDKFREQRIQQAKKASNISSLNKDVARSKIDKNDKPKKRIKLSSLGV